MLGARAVADANLRQLQRQAATGSIEDTHRFYDALCVLGRAVWVLSYGDHSTGLDNVILGLFTRRQVAVDHLMKHQPRAYPGWCRGGSAQRDAVEKGRWAGVNWRNVVLRCLPIHVVVQDEWFAKGDPQA